MMSTKILINFSKNVFVIPKIKKSMNPKGRPKKEEVFVQTSFRLPRSLLEEMDEYIKKEMLTRSIFIRKAISEYLTKHLTNEDLRLVLEAIKRNKEK